VAESLPGVALASWLATWTNLPGIAITITFVIVLFPDGRLPSPRWRPVGWLMAAATVVPAAVMAVRAWPG
jgi:two-component system, NarL family, sensor kinase